MQESAFWSVDCEFVLIFGSSEVWSGSFQAAMPASRRLLYIHVPLGKIGCAGYNTETAYGDNET
jgi:hypothetical protein